MKEKKKPSIKAILNTSLNVFFYIVIILLLTFSIANIQVKSQDNIPHVFGLGFLSVATDSMSGDEKDNFDPGDLIFVRMLNDKSRADLKVGDIITYYDMSIRAFNTHRIIEIGTFQDETYIITQGDNTSGADQPIRPSDAISVYRSTWVGAGTTLNYMQSSVGFALVVILPVFLILIYEGYVLAKNVLAVNKVKLQESMAIEKETAKKELEKEKERMKQELLEELKREQNK